MIIKKDNKILRNISKEVDLKKIKTIEIQNTIEKMKKELLKSADGVAIAAPQIGVNLRIFLIDEILLNPFKITETEKNDELKKKFIVFINPKIRKKSSKKNIMNEGCLSAPEVYGKVKRIDKLTVEAYDELGEKFQKTATKIFAQAIQHEIDHLDGVLFIDKIIKNEK